MQHQIFLVDAVFKVKPMGLLRFIRNQMFCITIVTLYYLYAPPPFAFDLDPEPFTTSPPVLDGPLFPNNVLDSAEKLYDGLLPHPECIDVLNGSLYTGLEDGRVVELRNNEIKTVFVSGGLDCGKFPRGCGRPNGIKFDKNGELIVADPPVGVYRLNVETGEKTTLFSTDTLVDGRKAKGCNHPEVGKNGDVYFSDVSTKREMYTNYYEFVEIAPNGRVLHYDPVTKTTETLVDKLYFPNGVQLSPDESFLIIAQSGKYNILKYHLRGENKGKLEVFVDNLPGVPDNIHSSGRGTFWIGLAGARLPNQQPLFELLGPYPLTRKLIGRVIHTLSTLIGWLADNLPFPVLQIAKETLEEKKLDLFLGRHYGIVLEVNTDGQIVRSLQSPSGHIYHISHALEHDGMLYLGSPFNNFIGKVKLPTTN